MATKQQNSKIIKTAKNQMFLNKKVPVYNLDGNNTTNLLSVSFGGNSYKFNKTIRISQFQLQQPTNDVRTTTSNNNLC